MSPYGGFVENDEVIILYDQARFAWLRILPKRVLQSPEEIERLRTLIRTHVTAKS